MTELKHPGGELANCRQEGASFRFSWKPVVGAAVVLLTLLFADRTLRRLEAADETAPSNKAEEAKEPVKEEDPYAWKSMFDGRSLAGWKVPKFGGDGEVSVKDGTIVLGMGDPMTGITWAGELPREDYELTLEAKRTKGIDFFATTTFPVGKDHVSFVTGGWAGTVVGISCVDFYDASDNITTQFMSFKDNQWYKIRIRVSEPKIECWIGDEKMVNLVRKGHKFDTRMEVDLNKPLGFSSYATEGVLRNIRIRRLKPEEVAAIKKETEEE